MQVKWLCLSALWVSSFCLAQVQLLRTAHSWNFSFDWDHIKTTKILGHTGGSQTQIEIKGLETLAEEPGDPFLPKYSRLLPVPDGFDVELESLEVEPIHVSVSHSIAFEEHPRSHCTGHAHVGRNLTVTDRPWVELSKPSYVGPIKVVRLQVNPVQMTSSLNTVRTSRRMSFRLKFVPSKSSYAPISISQLSDESKRVYRALFPDGASPELQREGREPHDLLIVHPSFASELSFMQLLRLKQSEGRKVSIVFSPDKAKTDEIKNIIKSHYAGSAPPTHTLLIGSIDLIPAYRFSDIWSDFPYTHLDSGELPDLSIARMAVRNPTELTAMVDKIVSRADAIPNPNQVLVTSGYETGWCHKNLAFIQENIFDKAESSLNITRLYATEGHKTDSIVNGYNHGPNFIIYDGHGTQKGMVEIPLLMEHLSRLSNSTYPVLFDIACLNSHWPSSGAGTDVFAQKLVTLSGAGPAGMVAASSSGDAHDLFRFMFRAAIHDETGSTPFHRIHEMGSVLYYGKLKYLESKGTSGTPLNDSRMFFYFGDPATKLF